jgi:flavorubredoxin
MTAVEFLVEQLAKNGILHSSNIAKAKEMEKQQIVEAHGAKLKKSRTSANYEYWYTGEMYYNDKYKM